MIAGYAQRALKEILLYKAQAPKHGINVSQTINHQMEVTERLPFPIL